MSLFSEIDTARLSREFYQPPTLPWIERGVCSAEDHSEIIEKITNIIDRNQPLPLHYALYNLMTINHGRLSETCRNIEGISSKDAEIVEKIVPDIAVNIHKLERAGYWVVDDPVNQIKNPKIAADGMKKVIRYAWPSEVDHNGEPTGSVYPLKEKVFGPILLESISKGLQDTFAVGVGSDMIASFCNVKKANPYGRSPFIELGRTATDYRYLPQLKKDHLSLRGVSQLRLLQLLLNPDYSQLAGKNLNYIYSDIRIMKHERITSDGKVLVPSGKSVQGVFFGGINHESNPVDLNFGIWGAGWQYVMGNESEKTGGCEPFLRIGRYSNEEQIKHDLTNRILWMPNSRAGLVTLAYLSSFVDVKSLNVKLLSPENSYPDYDSLVVLNPGLSTAYTSIDFHDVTSESRKNIAGKIDQSKVMPLPDALGHMLFSTGPIDHEVPYIEAYCECTTPSGYTDTSDVQRMAQRMNALLELGFTVTGITPSDKTDGIRMTFSLITKKGLQKGLVPFDLPDKYYRGNRTETAANIAKSVFEELEFNSRRSLMNKLGDQL